METLIFIMVTIFVLVFVIFLVSISTGKGKLKIGDRVHRKYHKRLKGWVIDTGSKEGWYRVNWDPWPRPMSEHENNLEKDDKSLV